MKRRLEAEPRLARRLEYPAGGAKRRTNAASTNGPGLMDRPRRFHLLWKTFAHRSRYIIVALCPSLFLPLRSEDPSPPPSVAVGRVSPELIAPRTPAAINLIKSENVPRPTMKLNGRFSSYRFRGKRKETSRANAEFRDSSIQIWKNRRFCFSDLPFFPFSPLFDMDFVLFPDFDTCFQCNPCWFVSILIDSRIGTENLTKSK